MKVFNTKEECQLAVNEINKKRGFKIVDCIFVGECMTSYHNVPQKGWYLFNLESRKISK